MADNNVSIVMTMKTDIDAKLRTIASTSQGCSKAFEEFQRRATELGNKFAALNTRYDDFSKKSASAKAEAEKLKLEMTAMTKAAKASGQELDTVKFESLQEEYNKLTDSAKGYTDAAKATLKEMRLIEQEARTMEFSEPEAVGSGGSDSSGGFLSKFFGKDLGGKLAQSGLLQMVGDSASSAISVFAESAFGQPLASAMSETLSGTLSGAAAGAIAGLPGMVLGGVVGTLSGALNAGTQIYAEQDESFKDYYRGLYEDTNAATAERVSSGSSLAAGRETTKLSFNTLLGDEQKAAAFLEQVKGTANTTPFLYDDLVGISKTMLSFGTAVDDIIPTLTKVGDAGAALGLSTGDIGTVATYLGRMQSSDKASLEYLNPLNERGLSVFQWLADDLGVSIAEVYEKISKSELSGNYVSDVILSQFEKLYSGMMDVQSKSTEGLDSTLQGLKENVDAAGGDAYNEARKESKEADIAAYSGALGDKLAELSAVTGQVQAYGENLKEQFQREALEAVLTGTLDKENTIFSEEDAEKLEALSQEFSEAEQAYKDGSLEAGKKMTDLREEAEALATAAYESSEWAQAVHDAELDQINATRELTTAMEAATNAWRENNAFSKGGADGNALLKFFGIGRTQEEQQARTASMEAQGDPMLVDIGGASGLASGRRAKGYAVGLDYVPYDEFPALLHQGERVKTAAEARMEDRSGGAVSVTITGNEFNVRGESDVDDIAEKIARKLQDALLRGG
ncbi:tape measure protein [uncultured Oscillibacter sp.]|uniref:tape measure protein n=1 Tax=uncultured Oscillibacter sp. TaxID=876091 RepID=UPI00262F2E2D|nr:tape measure protein [uncultured Oscillibacter sp.]